MANKVGQLKSQLKKVEGNIELNDQQLKQAADDYEKQKKRIEERKAAQLTKKAEQEKQIAEAETASPGSEV